MGVSKGKIKCHFVSPSPIRKIEEGNHLIDIANLSAASKYPIQKEENLLLFSALVRTVFAGVSVALQTIIVLKIFGVI